MITEKIICAADHSPPVRRDKPREAVASSLASADELRGGRIPELVAGGRPVEVIRFRLTEADRRALAQLRWP
jgi:hypothetical protein